MNVMSFCICDVVRGLLCLQWRGRLHSSLHTVCLPSSLELVLCYILQPLNFDLPLRNYSSQYSAALAGDPSVTYCRAKISKQPYVSPAYVNLLHGCPSETTVTQIVLGCFWRGNQGSLPVFLVDHKHNLSPPFAYLHLCGEPHRTYQTCPIWLSNRLSSSHSSSSLSSSWLVLPTLSVLVTSPAQVRLKGKDG